MEDFLIRIGHISIVLFGLIVIAVAINSEPKKDLRWKIKEVLKEFPDTWIYAENLRYILNVSVERAKRILDEAVAKGYVSRHVEIECPTCERGLGVFEYNKVTPFKKECWVCKDDNMEEFTWTVEDGVIDKYKINIK